MPQIESINQGLVLIALLGLLVVNQLLGLVKEWLKDWWDHRKGNGSAGAVRKLREEIIHLRACIANLGERLDGQPPYPQCYYDKEHFDRIARIEENTEFIRNSQEEQRRDIDRGRFSCKVREPHLRALEVLRDEQMRGA